MRTSWDEAGSAAWLLALGTLLVALVMVAVWLVQRRTGNAALVDVAWTANLGVLALLYAAFGTGFAPRRALLALAASAWSLRLAAHLFVDRVRTGHEDGRYATLRTEWGDRAPLRFFVFFQLQALFDVLLSIPFLLVSLNRAPRLHVLEIAAVALLIVAVIGEGVADAQLRRHRTNPANRGRTCRSGLWRYSRHPNYFFEWLSWCAFALMAAPAPFGALGLVSPAVLLLLILKFTGIPPTEAQALASRGDDYRSYQRTTSAFFPWFPKAEPAQ
jgi:steroid 5-alpha reductase family enzyme